MSIVSSSVAWLLGISALQAELPIIAAQAATQNAAAVAQGPRRRARGGAGTLITSGFVDDTDQNSEVNGDKWYGSPGRIGIADKMMRDPHVRQSVGYISDWLTSASWRYKSASDSALDREVADYCQWTFIERLAWRQILRRCVRGYVKSGFHLEEMTDDYRSIPIGRFPLHPGLGGIRGQGIVPTAFHELPPWTVHQWFQSKRNPSQIAGIEQYILGGDAEKAGFRKVRSNRLIRFSWDQEGAYYPGLAVLRSAFQPWKLKMAFLTIDAIKHERTGVGVATMLLGEDKDDPEDVETAYEILSEMRAHEKGCLVMRNGEKFEWTGAGESDSSNLDAAISRCNIDIAYNMGAGYMMLGLTGVGPGSFALSGTQQGAHHINVDSHGGFVSDVFNVGQDGWSPHARIVEINYGPKAGIPMLQARNLPTRPWIKITETVSKAIPVGAITADLPTENLLRESMGLDPLDASTARIRPPPGSLAPDDRTEREIGEAA